jgi:hypothetical protein
MDFTFAPVNTFSPKWLREAIDPKLLETLYHTIGATAAASGRLCSMSVSIHLDDEQQLSVTLDLEPRR